MEGKFITFEGIEGCGKTTQAKLLVQYLEGKGYRVLMTREPGGTAISEAVREILLSTDFSNMHPHTEVLLYLASRAQHVNEVIRPALDDGKIIVCDRFSDSTFVYQSLVRGLDMHMIKSINRFATGKLSPHLTFVLDIDPEEGLRRARSRNQKNMREEDRIEKEAMDFHQRVREGYLKWAAENPDRLYVVRSDREKEEVHEEIVGLMEKTGKFQ
ncbi:MAG: dTMP kinase [Nitrospirae bacterium]|nr:dTMP kinase [Nitrospirota bacterium]